MIKVSSFGKFLDQPLLTAKLNKQVPTILTAGSSLFILNEMKNSQPENRAKTGCKLSVILAATTLSAIKAPKIASYLTGRKASKTLKEITAENTQTINEMLSKKEYSKELTKILEKAKNKILSIKDVNTLRNNISKEQFDKLIPPPDNITSKDIFKEIGWLSIFGAVPVAGGIAGGIAADRLTEKHWKHGITNKIKEGVYQYLANIFMCNIGAGVALGILEKLNIKSKAARCVGMVSGIILTGIIGGSAIANYIGNKFINPLISNDKKKDNRTPELLDIGLHTDDIATVSLLSGLKWIEPSLPILYAVSGYRAGIGYRNDHKHHRHHNNDFLREKC
ncbi:hypothetical protein HDR58_10000 [bacterium]|nr:hypothetical protein [bacterium]